MFKVDRSKTTETKFILYILELYIEGKTVVKVGVTSRKVEERVVEILTSYFHAYREFPYCRPKRYRKVYDAYDYEAKLLGYFKDRSYKSGKLFSGCTELVDVPLDEVVEVYEYLLEEGKLPEGEGQLGCSSDGDTEVPVSD